MFKSCAIGTFMSKSKSAALLVVFLCTASAFAAPTIQANVPNFYQHQKAWNPGDAWVAPGAPSYGGANWWESAIGESGARQQVGWCGTTAWLGAIYNWSTRGYTDLFDHSAHDPQIGPPYHGGRTWLERANYANGDLALRSGGANGGCAWVPSVRDYVRANTVSQANPGGIDPEIQRYSRQNGRIERLTDVERPLDRNWDGTNLQLQAGVDSGYSSFYSLFTDMMDRGSTCVVRIGASTNANNNGNWWTNFHVLTGAGYEEIMGANGVEQYLYLADPNKTSAFVGAGADWGHAYAVDSFGGGAPIGLAQYTRVRVDNNKIIGGAFDNSMIDAVYTMWVPTPGTASFMLVSLFAIRRRR